MSTLLEIEEAIKSLPADQIEELACWLDDIQTVKGIAPSQSGDYLAAQIETARRRMQALDSGKTDEIPGETAHAIVRDFIKPPR
ncbi:MAG TPA: hypothetical protein VHM91_13455 [Verrucomicrobiales bacterium]|jgi:hypothetical protein|nr:hypothetical protein [Verrucomicrobiales bacterium]